MAKGYILTLLSAVILALTVAMAVVFFVYRPKNKVQSNDANGVPLKESNDGLKETAKEWATFSQDLTIPYFFTGNHARTLARGGKLDSKLGVLMVVVTDPEHFKNIVKHADKTGEVVSGYRVQTNGDGSYHVHTPSGFVRVDLRTASDKIKKTRYGAFWVEDGH